MKQVLRCPLIDQQSRCGRLYGQQWIYEILPKELQILHCLSRVRDVVEVRGYADVSFQSRFLDPERCIQVGVLQQPTPLPFQVIGYLLPVHSRHTLVFLAWFVVFLAYA